MSGVLTRFWYGHKKVGDKLWLNLHTLLKNIVNLSVPKCVVFGIYGSKISDLTNYRLLYYDFGKLIVKVKREKVPFSGNS